MKYYTNAELSKKIGVSLPTIANWIKDTLQNKKQLELIEKNGKYYVVKSHENITLMQGYAKTGFKYKPTNARTVSSPKPEFLQHLTDKQLIEIKKNILDKKSLDIKFGYISGGADTWDTIYENSNSWASRFQ